ncbi:MAG: DUF1257 domain-containing protein [Spirochaetota bacterium]|nr:DUF1257 domain-containing protein [Spirochaetota bacterium]
MSHFTKIKTNISNLNILKQTLKDLNIVYNESDINNKLTIKGWNNENVEVLLELKTGCSYGVGVVLNEENNTYEFVADWWGVETGTEVTQEDYINKITQKYAYNTVMDKIRSKGYEIVSEDVDEETNVKIVLRKWE